MINRFFFILFFCTIVPIVFYAQGYICAIGGGSENYNSWSDDPYEWIVENSDSGSILILSYSDQDNWLVDYFISLGASSAQNLKISSRSTADQQNIYDRIVQANAVFIKGGDQWKYVSNWKGTKTHEAIKTLYENGGVVAGTSAGAMILSEFVFSAQFESIYPRNTIINPLSSNVAIENDFLNLMPNSLFDTHFIERGRFARLIGMMYNVFYNHGKKILGIGIDDRTAICIDKNLNGMVYGSGAVSIFQFDENTLVDASDSDYKIENLKCDKLVHGWEFNFSNKFVIGYSEGTINVEPKQKLDLPKSNIFLTGNTNISLNVAQHLENFITNSNSDNICIIADENSENEQDALINRLTELQINFDIIYISPDSLNNTNYADRLNSSSSIIVNLNNYVNGTLLNDTSTLVGEAYNIKISENTNFLFLGNSGKLSGSTFIYNTDVNDLASYRGLMRIGIGNNIFGDFVFQPMIFADSDYYENRTSALTYGLMRGRKKIGLYLDFDSRANINHIYNTIIVEGGSPLIIVDARNTTHIDSSEYRVNGGAGYRQVVGMNNLRYTISKKEKIFSIESGRLTSVENIKINNLREPTIELFLNYPNPFNSQTTLAFSIQEISLIKFKVFNALGEEVYSLPEEKFNSGYNEIHLDFTKFSAPSAGVYFVNFRSSTNNVTQKIVYLK